MPKEPSGKARIESYRLFVSSRCFATQFGGGLGDFETFSPDTKQLGILRLRGEQRADTESGRGGNGCDYC
jgi:hypothetical protein